MPIINKQYNVEKGKGNIEQLGDIFPIVVIRKKLIENQTGYIQH